jgi:hypothetical protein
MFCSSSRSSRRESFHLAGSLQPSAQTLPFASQSELQVGETHIQVLEETGEFLVQFGATLPAALAQIIAVGTEVEALNRGRAAMYWPWAGARTCGASTAPQTAARPPRHQLLGPPLPSYQQLAAWFGITLTRAWELVGEVVRCGLDVIPENDPKNLCPNLGGCGAFRRALATRLLDARVNFGEWRIQRTALDARLRAMKLESRNFEGLTNVGHDYAGRRERDDQGCRRGGPRVQSAKCRPLVAHGERQRYGEGGRKPEMTD